MRTRFLLVFLLIFSLQSLYIHSLTPPKREFRGTWIHTVGQDRYMNLDEVAMKRYFATLLDSLQLAGINTVIFQVRPEADAWFNSPFEPWSRYITGVQGKNPGWDPTAYLIDACHRRNMDFHAWINPYRVRTSPTKTLSPDHLYFRNPWMFVEYGEYIWFDPGIPACRAHIVKVVKDLVARYDIDALHMDDYFYPYPVNGQAFDDSRSFREFGLPKGFTEATKADWRRQNVNSLIKELHDVLRSTKPWVRFGISPFGIYRNASKGTNGSKTNGFTNYEGLYADIMLWVNKGWVDYVVPQLYWEIGHRVADYKTLLYWWAGNKGQVSLYIGQDVLRTVKPDSLKHGQLWLKMQLAARERAVTGHCFWPAYELENNAGGIVDSLRTNYFRYPALPPADNRYDMVPPQSVRNLHLTTTAGRNTLNWLEPEALTNDDKAAYYVVYGFKRGETINLEKASRILGIVKERAFRFENGNMPDLCVVTAVDRFHNESKGVTLTLR